MSSADIGWKKTHHRQNSNCGLVITTENMSSQRTQKPQPTQSQVLPITVPMISRKRSAKRHDGYYAGDNIQVLQRLLKNKGKYLSQKMKSLIVLNYQPRYNFKEQYEREKEEGEKTNIKQENQPQEQQLLYDTDRTVFIVQLILFLCNLAFLWAFSVGSVFKQALNDHLSSLSIVLLIATVFDSVKDLNKATNDDKVIYNTRKMLIKKYLRWRIFQDIICILGAIFNFIPVSQSLRQAFMVLISLVSLIKAKRKYSDALRCRLESSSNFDRIINLAEMFMIMFLVSHTFSLLLFSSSFIGDSQVTWTSSIKIDFAEWHIQYLYSLYWATTIMVTVGFGDITPQNQYEVFLIVIIQFIGVAIFAYVVNTIGLTMTEITRSSEKLNNELKTVDRIASCFGLNGDLAFRIKKHIRSTHQSHETFSIEEEKHIARSLSPSLNEQMLRQTNIHIVKKSVFFISHFTINFMDSIALKLTKRLFQPEEPIPSNNNRMYVIGEGSLDLFAIRQHNSFRQVNKLIKRLRVRKGQTVGCNIYGYTHFLTDRPVGLKAVSKSITVAYELEKNAFLQVLYTNPRDLECYFQLRDKMISRGSLEQLEGPKLIDSYHHYVPLRHHVVKRYLYSNKQQRRYFSRKDTQTIKSLAYQNKLPTIEKDKTFIARSMVMDDTCKYERSILSRMSKDRKPSWGLVQDINDEVIDYMPSYTRLHTFQRLIDENIDIKKEYECYYPQNNYSAVEKKYKLMQRMEAISRRNKTY